MKLSLVVVPLLLMVVTVACHNHRPSYFGRKYVVYGDTKQIVCYRSNSRLPTCTTRWYQMQYFQNLDNPGIILHIDSNQKKVYERNFYNRSRIFGRYYRQRLDVSTNRCRLTLQRLPILHVPASFTYHGIAEVEGKRCQIWQRVTKGIFGSVTFRTWYVRFHSLGYEPVRYVYRYHESIFSETTFTRITNWRGYNPGVKDSDLTLPAQCY